MPIDAIQEETKRLMTSVTGDEDADLNEEFEEVSYIIEELEENIKDKDKMIDILSRDEGTTHESLPKYKSELQELKNSLVKWEDELITLKKQYSEFLKEVTGAELSGTISEIEVSEFKEGKEKGRSSAGFTKEEEIKILQVGLNLLELKKDAKKSNFKEVLSLPDPKQIEDLNSRQKEEEKKLGEQGLRGSQYRKEFWSINERYSQMKRKLLDEESNVNIKIRDEVKGEIANLDKRIYRAKKGIANRNKKDREIKPDADREEIDRSLDAILARKEKRQEESKDSPSLSKPKGPSNLGWKSKLFAQDVADTSKTMRTQSRKNKFIEDLSVFLNENTKKGMKGIPDVKPYRAKKWQDPHGMGKVRYSSGGQKSLTLAPAEIRIENLENLKRIISGAPKPLVNENPQIHRRILIAIDKELESENTRKRKQELKMTRSGEKRGEKAVSNLVQILEKMRNILKRWDFQDQLPKPFLQHLRKLGQSDLESWDLEKLSRGVLPDKSSESLYNKREAEISEIKISDKTDDEKEEAILDIHEKYDSDKYKYAGLLSEDMLAPIKEILNDSIKGKTTLYEVIKDYWHLREGGEQKTDFTNFLQESIGNLYAELNPYLTGEERPDEPIEVDNIKRAKVLMEKLKTYMDALPEQVENIENRQTIIGNFERTFQQLDSIMEDDIEDKIDSADKDRLDKIRDSLKEFLQVPLSQKDLKQQTKLLPHKAKRQMQEILNELTNYANEVISNSDNEEWKENYIQQKTIKDEEGRDIVVRSYETVNDKLKAYIDAHLPLPVREKRQSKEDYEGNLAKRKTVINRIIMGQNVDAKDMKFGWKSKKISQEKEELIEDDIRELDEEYDESDVGERETEEILEGRERSSLEELDVKEREELGNITSEEYEEQEAERLEQEGRDRVDEEYWQSQSEEDDLI